MMWVECLLSLEWLVDQKHTDSTTHNLLSQILWCTVACDLARLFPSLRQHLAQGNQGHDSSDIDRLFKSLIEVPLIRAG